MREIPPRVVWMLGQILDIVEHTLNGMETGEDVQTIEGRIARLKQRVETLVTILQLREVDRRAGDRRRTPEPRRQSK
jgi:hypothetical protein